MRKGQSDSCIMLQKRCLYSKIYFLKLCVGQNPQKCLIILVNSNGGTETLSLLRLSCGSLTSILTFHALISLSVSFQLAVHTSLSSHASLHPSAPFISSSISLSRSIFALVSGLPVFFHLAFSAFVVVFF